MVERKLEFKVRGEKNTLAFVVTVSDGYVEIETDGGCKLYEAPDLLHKLADALEHELGDQA